uniref:Putative tail tubular protein n=1 Tax=viral metagenome TaxID=1070528 RepID=A0A6M3IFA1_9ZZZZ
MEETAIIAAIRRGIREPSPVTIDDDGISAVILRGVTLLGQMILETDPSFLNVRKSVSSYTHVFTKPSDCLLVRKVWDLGTTAVSITNATNASPIVVTAASHGLSDDDIVFIHDVGGNTETNGTHLITYIDADSFSLDGTTGNAAYTSGGKVYKDPSDPPEITMIDMQEANLSHSNKWYPRDDKIVVDDSGFTNDIILDYVALPDSISDIQSGFHEWLVSFGIVDLMTLNPEEKDYYDKQKTLQFHGARMSKMEHFIRTNYVASSEPSYIRDVMKI